MCESTDRQADSYDTGYEKGVEGQLQVLHL